MDFDPATGEVEVHSLDLDLRSDEGRPHRLRRARRDLVGEREPKPEARHAEEQQGNDGLPAEHGDAHVRAPAGRGGTGCTAWTRPPCGTTGSVSRARRRSRGTGRRPTGSRRTAAATQPTRTPGCRGR